MNNRSHPCRSFARAALGDTRMLLGLTRDESGDALGTERRNLFLEYEQPRRTLNDPVTLTGQTADGHAGRGIFFSVAAYL